MCTESTLYVLVDLMHVEIPGGQMASRRQLFPTAEVGRCRPPTDKVQAQTTGEPYVSESDLFKY